MNKVKVSTIFFLAFLFLGVWTSCDSEEIEKIQEGYGAVSFSLKTDTAFVLTKADPENIEEYKIQILKSNKVIKSYNYNSLPDKVELEPGNYTAKAYWGKLTGAAFESMYMEGQADFAISKNKTTQVSLLCEPANAKVTVDYSSEVTTAYSNYSVAMSTIHTTSPLFFSKSETRAGYFQADEGGDELKLDMSFFVGSEKYTFNHSTEIYPKDFVRFHVKMDPNGIVPTMRVSPGYYYTDANGGGRDFIVYTNQEEWMVSYDADWIEVIEWDSYVTINVYPNDTEELRRETISFEAIYKDKTAVANIIVVQEPVKASNTMISVTPPYIQALPEGEQGTEVLVTTDNKDWTIEDYPQSWLTAKKQDDKLILDVTANNTKALRSGVVTVKTQKDGKTATATVFVFQEALASSGTEESKLILTVNIKDVSATTEIPCMVEATPIPSIKAIGFEDKKVLNIKAGQAPANIRVNIQALGKIAECNFYNPSAIDLTESDNTSSELSNAGLLWDGDMKEQTLSTIYLDKFINNLSVGSHSFRIEVVDKLGKTASVSLTLKITN